MLRRLLNPKNKAVQEEGFTLVEITITIMILGILSTIAVTTINEQIRNAQLGTLKSDIRANLPHILTPEGHIATPEDFASKARSTDVNIVSLAVDGVYTNGGTQIACVWGTRVFSENDVVSYYWSSETGKMQNGTCLGEYPNAVIIGTSTPGEDPVEEEAHSHDNEGGVGAGEETYPDEEETGTSNPTGENPGGVADETNTNPDGNVGSGNNANQPTTPGAATPSESMRVVICHAQGNSKQSRWTSISPNSNGTLNGHIPNHKGDIVPPIEGVLPNGHNWTTANIAIWNNGCQKV